MKTTELMIGDWLQHAGGKCFRVTRIDKRYNDSVHFACGHPHLWEYNNKFTPSPLTPEILENNGFEKTLDEDNIECYCYYNRAADGYIKITLYDRSDCSWSVEIVNYDKFDDNEIRYKNQFSFLKVHELQHALRLCGIDKEIEL